MGIEYSINLPFEQIKPGEPVLALGLGKFALEGYKQPNPVIAGIGLMTHPSEWSNLLNEYPIAKYLQHCNWAMDIYIPYFGKEKCDLWPAGVDTNRWRPGEKSLKKTDFLIYNKIRWDHEQQYAVLRNPIIDKLNELGYSFKEIIYGNYNETEYFKLLKQCRAMIFLCEHESQGIACCEALSMDVPVIAWDQGFWLDPNRFQWNDPAARATSVPFFDERCGVTFKDFEAFNKTIASFYHKVETGNFKPREYILENLTLKKSAERMLYLINSVYK